MAVVFADPVEPDRPTPPPPHSHVVQFYDDAAFLADAITRYIGDGITAGHPAVLIARPEHRKAVLDRLGSQPLDVERLCAAGHLVLLDAEETLARFMIDGAPDRLRFEEVVGTLVEELGRRGAGTPRAYGEMVDILWQQGKPEAALALEEMWNGLAGRLSFTLLCGYSLANFPRADDGEGFARVCRAHTHVVPAEPFSGVREEDRLREVSILQQRTRALEAEVSRRRELEDALRESRAALVDALDREQAARRDAEQANRAKDEFLAMLGHELRNPLAPITTALQLARLRGTESHELSVIERQVGSMVRMVDDLLDVSRILRGKLELRMERLEIAEAAAEALEVVSPMLERRRQTVQLDVPRSGCAVVGDRARLAQVITNLLTNASKYSEVETCVAISARAVDGKVEVRVRDQGVGIDPAMLERVFEPFVQQPQSIERSQGGLGIGLSIVRNVIRLHGGEVTARSAGPGKGSEITLTLPVAAPVEVAARSVAAVVPGAQTSAAAPVRVLVVDDNEDAATLLAEALGALGYEVRVAHDGPSALRVAAEHRPHVGLLDLGLPVMDGYELASRVRAEDWGKGVRLVALTGYGRDKDRALSLEIGFDEHVVKPINLSTLQRLLADLTVPS
ncbi:MAG TPA: ATP-binding protein [Kofleriaceae bacterium]|nr:ATP-binding protein [Kofleriaceae bacterium]